MTNPNMVIPVANDELMTVRDGMRTLNMVIDRLCDSPDARKAVLTRGGKMVAVVLSVDEYCKLLAAQGGRETR